MATRQQLEQQLVAAHRSGNVQAAQQAAYAIRSYDQSALSAQVPSINAPPPIERVPKPTFGSWLENVGIGIGDEWGRQIQGLGESVQRGVSAFAKDPLKASAAAFMTALEPARQGFTQPVQTAKGIGTGIAETVGQMGQQAASGPIGFGQVVGQVVDMPGPNLPGGKRRPTMAELDVYHGTPHTFEPEEGAPLGRFRSSKIGTGEGAQAYGYGLYLAEDPDVADAYRVNLSYDPEKIRVGGKQINEVYSAIERNAARMPPNKAGIEYEKMQLLEQLMMNDSLNKVAKQAAEMSPETAHWFEKQVKPTFETYGRNYKVDLPDAKIEQMLDWDKPLSEQPKAVQDVLASSDLTGTAGYLARTPEKTTAGELYKALSNSYGQKEVSEYFRKGGIPGIKYLDAGSRDGGNGTRNFVVFPGEEQNLTILERDGVKAEVPKPAAPKPRAAPQYNFAKESQRVSNLVNAENVSLADYEPKTKKLNTTYAGPAKKDRFGYLQEFKLKRKMGDDQEINVYVSTDELGEDLPDSRFDPNDPPYMFSSYVDYSGETAPKGTGALTQMTLEALEIVKRDKGGKSGWISEGVRSAETDAKYERLIAAGVPFQRTETGTYFLMPQDLQTLDLNKVSDTLNKKYGNRK